MTVLERGHHAMIRLLAATLFLLLSACAANDGPESEANGGESAVITGTVYYRERIALPPGSEVTVVLLDVSKMDVPATQIAETRFAAEQGPPFAFSLPYDAGLIKPGMRYSLRATITRDGQLLFTSTSAIDPFDTVPVKILVQKVGGR